MTKRNSSSLMIYKTPIFSLILLKCGLFHAISLTAHDKKCCRFKSVFSFRTCSRIRYSTMRTVHIVHKNFVLIHRTAINAGTFPVFLCITLWIMWITLWKTPTASACAPISVSFCTVHTAKAARSHWTALAPLSDGRRCQTRPCHDKHRPYHSALRR